LARVCRQRRDPGSALFAPKSTRRPWPSHSLTLLQINLRIQVANAPKRLLSHPFSVISDVLGQPLSIPIVNSVPSFGMNWRIVFEAWWDLDHRLADHHRDRVEVRPKRREAKALRLKWDRLTNALTQDGDGLSVAELTAECAGTDLDATAAKEQTIDDEVQELRNRLMEARETRNAARQAFEAIGGDDKAARDAADRRRSFPERVGLGRQLWQFGATLGATPRGHTRSSWGAEGPYFTGLSRRRFIMAEREGFEPRFPVPNDKLCWLLIGLRLRTRWNAAAQTPPRCEPSQKSDPAEAAAPEVNRWEIAPALSITKFSSAAKDSITHYRPKLLAWNERTRCSSRTSIFNPHPTSGLNPWGRSNDAGPLVGIQPSPPGKGVAS
jgi:hypothetical protein